MVLRWDSGIQNTGTSQARGLRWILQLSTSVKFIFLGFANKGSTFRAFSVHLEFVASQASSMGYFYLLVLVMFSWSCFCLTTNGLQSYQTQLLLRIRKHLEYPPELQILENYNGDLCNLSETSHLMISCQDNFVTEIKIRGDKLANISGFNGYAIPGKTLSEIFSIDSLVTTLTRLTSLRVLSLVSLGMWGPLPDKIHRLYSLELLDLSSNYMFGSIPPQISRMVKLQTLTLDGNYFNDTIPDTLDSLSNLTVLSLRGQ
ncbi:hypothetical protein V6N13_111786 [Hibiscus sabdariffa]